MMNTEPKEIYKAFSFLCINMVGLSYIFYICLSHDNNKLLIKLWHKF